MTELHLPSLLSESVLEVDIPRECDRVWGDGIAMRTAMHRVDGDEVMDGATSVTSAAGTRVVVVDSDMGRGRWMCGQVGQQIGIPLNRWVMGERGAGVWVAFPVVMSLGGALT